LWKEQNTTITPAAITYTEYSGLRKQVILADGSTVTLNSNSKLKVPSNYNQSDRHLLLEGEALFDVAKDDQRPFTVTAGKVNVEALGTTFKVSAYVFNKGITVLLLSGKVRVNAKEELLPGQSATAVNDVITKSTFDVALEEDWRLGRLHFKDASLKEMADLLEFWYGIKVHIKPGNYQPIHFNGVFINKPMPDVLASITYITGLKTNISQGELFISH
jgi:ferric-dicitrate binding protein FerR (iron transport regulator)